MTNTKQKNSELEWLIEMAELEEERGPFPSSGAGGGIVARSRRGEVGGAIQARPGAAIRARDRVRCGFQAVEKPKAA